MHDETRTYSVQSYHTFVLIQDSVSLEVNDELVRQKFHHVWYKHGQAAGMSGHMWLMHTGYRHERAEGEQGNKSYIMMKGNRHHGPGWKDSRVRMHAAAVAEGSWRHVGRDILYKGRISLTGRPEISLEACGMID